MNKNKKYVSSRVRRERTARARALTHLLIIFVALIECLVLVTFTTYSWIESSSSLIISTGKNGGRGVKELSLAVPQNLNYQVLLSADAAGNVALTDNEYNTTLNDGGFYRSVRYFSYARTTSADGKTFFFKKPNNAGWLAGDTANYNTSYTYVDFELKNTTKEYKGFYFDPNVKIFEFKGEDATLSNNKKASEIIQNAMRLSIQQGVESTDNPVIYSLNGKTANAIATGGTPQQTTSRNITEGYTEEGVTHSYKYTGETTDAPIFESEPNGAAEKIDKISVRIWFEMTDADYAALSVADKATVDALLAKPESLQINIAFINDNVDYDQLYFDDFAFSSLAAAAGKFVTDETAGYGMYLHVWNQKKNGYINYPMSRSVNNDNPALRWMCSVPIPYVVEERNDNDVVVKQYLTANNTYFQNACFYYGNETTQIYKWKFPSTLSIQKVNNKWQFTDSCASYRNLGVVRSENNQSYPIEGFIQRSDDSSGAMQLVNMHDNTTALTSNGYNAANASQLNELFIINSVKNSTVSGSASSSFDYTQVENYESIYCFDIPKDSYVLFYNGVSYNDGQTEGSPDFRIEDGKCYTTGTESGSHYYELVEYDTNVELPKLNDPTGMNVRVYFYKTVSNSNWSTVVAHPWSGVAGGDYSEKSGTLLEDASDTNIISEETLRFSNVYLNVKNGSSYESDAKKTVSMYYDSRNTNFKAYVPVLWMTGGFDIHFNQLEGYYSVNSDKVRWSTGPALLSDTYTCFGYTDASTLASNTLAGVGTWGETREIRFSTELINTSINSANRYKLDFGSGAYPMVPDDDLNLTFKGYIPKTATFSFKRYQAYSGTNANATWTPHETLGDKELTYYPVVANGTGSGTEGWFHVAVLVDATFNNLIYDTVIDATNAVDGASLSYSYDGEEYTVLASKSGSTITDQSPYRIDKRRWVVPMMSGNTIYGTVYFKWVPYPTDSDSDGVPDTQFIYQRDVSDSAKYVIVTETR